MNGSGAVLMHYWNGSLLTSLHRSCVNWPSLFIYGGHDGEMQLNDLHCLHIRSSVASTWSKVCSGFTPTPSTRSLAIARVP